MKFFQVLFCLAASFSFYAPAQAAIMDCAVNPSGMAGDWITDRYIFDYEPDSTSVRVLDEVIQAFNGGPVTGKRTASAKKSVFSWTVITVNDGGQQTKMQYRAAYFAGTKAVTITAVPGGYANMFEGRGTCGLK